MRRIFLSLVGVFILLTAGVSGDALAASSSFAYCVGDFVIPQGVNGPSDVATAYKFPRVSHVYQHFGITQQDMNNISAQAVSGTVTKSGDVTANGKLVATNAITAGCQNIAGSTTVNDGYMTFYTRPTSVSFASSSLHALVVMKNGQFAYAVLTSCGNPVMATPTTPATPAKVTPKPAPVKPTPTPAPTQSQTQTQTVTINTPPALQAATTTATTTQPTAVTKTLPNTGPGNILALSGTTTAIGTIGHMIYSRRSRRSH